MHSSLTEPEPPIINFIKSKFVLLACSIINILLFTLCIGLEAANPVKAVFIGYWGSITFVVTGLLSFSASYTPTNALIITTLVFSSMSIIFAIVSFTLSAFFYAIGLGFEYYECPPFDVTRPFNVTIPFDDDQCVYGHDHPITQLALAITCFVAIINNIIVTVLCSKIICKCCSKSVNSTIPIAAAVHNNQHQTPMWTISSPGQPPQYQVIYSPYQQQPMEQQYHQSASALSTGKSDEPMNLTHLAPPPYSTVAELAP